MSKARYIFAVVCILLLAGSAGAQINRSFDYAVDQPDEALALKMNNLEKGLIAIDSAMTIGAKVAIVDSIMGRDRQQLSIAGKAFADQGKLALADAVVLAMRERHARFPYTTLLSAYVAQQRGMRYTSEADKLLRYSEFNDAAARLEELAELVADTLPLQREWLLAAGEMRFQAEDGVNTRTDLERVLSMRPSPADSLDIRIMLAKFDRAEAALALRDSNYVFAREYYDRAIEAYRAYLNQAAGGGKRAVNELPKDAYTADVIEDYLLSLNNRAYAERLADGSLGGYNTLLTETHRFASVKADDIRFQRYQLGAYFQLCTADSTLFQRYQGDYRQCMNYITEKRFPDTAYTYDDYNYAQQWATFAGDRRMRAEYLSKCVETFNDKGGQAGLVDIKQDLYSALIATYRNLGETDKEGDALRDYNAYRRSIDADIDLTQGEMLVVRNTVERLQKQRDARTMADEKIAELADEAKATLAKYLTPEATEDNFEAALRLTNNLTVSMIYLAPSTPERNEWFDSYAALLEAQIEKWRASKEEWEFSSRHHTNLYNLINSYVMASAEDGLLRAQRKGFDVYFRELAQIPQAEVKDEFLAANFHNFLLVLLQHHDYEVMPQVCDSLDKEMLLRCREQADIATRLQNEQLTFYTTLRDVEYNDETAHRLFYRKHFFTTLADYVEADVPLAIIPEMAHNLCGKYEEWMTAYTDLTESEQAAAYWLLARGYYSRWAQAHRAYAADKVAASQRQKKATAIALAEKGYLYASKCVGTKVADKFVQNAIEIYEDYNYLKEAVERAKAQTP